MSGLDADVAVVGLGAMGSTTAWRLAERGVDVIGVERFRPGHDQGSSHGGTRLFRTLCMEHPNLVAMARESMRLWRELEASRDVSLLQLTGGLMLGPAGAKVISGTRLAAEAAGVELHDIPRDALAERWPEHVSLGADDVGLFDPMAGVLDPEAGVIAACAAAAAAGASAIGHTLVTRRETFAVAPGIAPSRVGALRQASSSAYGQLQLEYLLAGVGRVRSSPRCSGLLLTPTSSPLTPPVSSWSTCAPAKSCGTRT